MTRQSAKSGLPVRHHHPVAHRQVLALITDLRTRLDHLKLTPDAHGRIVSLGSVHAQALDSIVASVLVHGDAVARDAEQAFTAAVIEATGELSTVGRMFYVVVCETCAELSDDRLEMPFYSAAARGAWCEAHHEATGHNAWTAWDTIR